MKKTLLLVLSLVIVLALSACNNGNSNVVTLEFAIKDTGDTLAAYETIVSNFNSENEDIQVEIVDYGKDYGSLMLTKMASNDLPDLWTTHGWAVFLYGDYLLPLNDRPWTDSLVEEIIPTMTDLDGNLVALPLDIDITGMIYNETLLNELSIDVPTNMIDFLDACETVKLAGKTCIHVAGSTSDVAGLVSRISLSMLQLPSNDSNAEKLYDGTFNWAGFDVVGDFINSLVDNEYFNVDYLTADKTGTYNGFAQNQVAFAFQSNGTIAEVAALTSDVTLKMMAIPGKEINDDPILVSGERHAVGVWKDTEHKEAALKFIDYLAQPENAVLIANSYSIPVAIKDVEQDADIEALLSAIVGQNVVNHFDREYLPNGMWGSLKVYGPSILSGEFTSSEGSEYMKDEYLRLRGN